MTDTTRRRFLPYGVGAGAALAIPATARRRFAAAAQRGLTAASSGRRLRKFREPLPLPGAGIVVAMPSGTNRYSFTQRQIARRLHPDLPPTPLWAYDDGSGLAGQAGSFGMALVGTFATIRARFDLPKGVTGPQSYVHHCHIVEHEDNDMMRPFTVTP